VNRSWLLIENGTNGADGLVQAVHRDVAGERSRLRSSWLAGEAAGEGRREPPGRACSWLLIDRGTNTGEAVLDFGGQRQDAGTADDQGDGQSVSEERSQMGDLLVAMVLCCALPLNPSWCTTVRERSGSTNRRHALVVIGWWAGGSRLPRPMRAAARSAGLRSRSIGSS
jgi:hypothetical protein